MRTLILNKHFLLIFSLFVSTSLFSQDESLLKQMFTFKKENKELFKNKKIEVKIEKILGSYHAQNGSTSRDIIDYLWKYEDETEWRSSGLMKAYKFNNDREAIKQLRIHRLKKTSSYLLVGFGAVFGIGLPQEKQLTYAEGIAIGLPLFAGGIYLYYTADKAFYKSAEIFNSNISKN